MNLISDFISASKKRMKMKLYSATTNRTNPKVNNPRPEIGGHLVETVGVGAVFHNVVQQAGDENVLVIGVFRRDEHDFRVIYLQIPHFSNQWIMKHYSCMF